MSSVESWVNDKISKNKVMVFSKTYCPYCTMAKDALKAEGVAYELEEIENRDDCAEVQQVLKKLTGGSTVPRVFINGKCIGGGTETKALAKSGKLKQMVGA